MLIKHICQPFGTSIRFKKSVFHPPNFFLCRGPSGPTKTPSRILWRLIAVNFARKYSRYEV